MATRAVQKRNPIRPATRQVPPLPVTKPLDTRVGSRAALSTVTNTTTAGPSHALRRNKSTKPDAKLEVQPRLVRPSLHKKTIVSEALKVVSSKVALAVNPPPPIVTAKVEPIENVVLKLEPEPIEDAEPMECSPAEVQVLRLGFSSLAIPEGVADIDARSASNPYLVGIYAAEVYQYLRELEQQMPVKDNYLLAQTEVTSKMRGILIDWLVLVQLKFELTIETLYMTVSIIDRYLQLENISRSQLQLLGITAMLVASKYEEMLCPEVSDFVYIADNTYRKEEVISMEVKILTTLKFQMGRPLPIHFLRRYSNAAGCDSKVHNVAKFFMELSLVDIGMVAVPPSLLAASAIYLSLKLIQNRKWDEQLIYYTSYEESSVLIVARRFCHLILRSRTHKLQSVRDKYSSSKLDKASSLPVLYSQEVVKMAGDAV